MDIAEQRAEVPQDKVVISVSTKGVVTWEIQAYAPTMEAAHAKAIMRARYLVKAIAGGGWKEVTAETEAEALLKGGVDQVTGYAVLLGQGFQRGQPLWSRDRRKQICPKCQQPWARHESATDCPPPPERKRGRR